MKTTTYALALVLCLVLGSAGEAGAWSVGRGVKGSGDLETRTLDLDDFDRIEVAGSLDLEITMGQRQSVAITIDDNLWDLLEAEVDGGTLLLDWSRSCRPDGDCKAVITLPSLESIRISGASEVRIEDFRGDSFSFVCSGASDLEMDGEVDELEVVISGASDVDTRDLKAKRVKVSISGAGDADVYASESLTGTISGVGDLDYYGDPEVRDTHVSGLGSIQRH